jgi:hypothetical protein
MDDYEERRRWQEQEDRRVQQQQDDRIEQQREDHQEQVREELRQQATENAIREQQWQRQQEATTVYEPAQRAGDESLPDNFFEKQRGEEQRRAQEDDEVIRQLTQSEDQRLEQTRAAVTSYNGTFADTAAIKVVWEKATRDLQSYKDGAQAAFWHSVNNDSSPEARQVRDIVRIAGYELQGGNRAPQLKVDYQQSRPEDAGRQKADRTLSIDHIVPQSDVAGMKRSLDPSNLRFMLQRDNSTLGAWNKGKDPSELDTGRTFSKPLSPEEKDAYRERVNSKLREKSQEHKRLRYRF